VNRADEITVLKRKVDALEKIVGRGWCEGGVGVPYQSGHGNWRATSLCDIAVKAVSFMGMEYKRGTSGAIVCPEKDDDQ